MEQSPERQNIGDIRAGGKRGNRMARGTTYVTRAEAVQAAQAAIDARLSGAVDRHAKYRTKYTAAEVRLWGGVPCD